MAFKVFLSPPYMGGKEMEYIKDAFDTNWIAPYGPSLNAFEKEQLVYNGVNSATIGCLQQQINALLGMTKMVIPNSSVCPGWGEAKVTVSTGTATT